MKALFNNDKPTKDYGTNRQKYPITNILLRVIPTMAYQDIYLDISLIFCHSI